MWTITVLISIIIVSYWWTSIGVRDQFRLGGAEVSCPNILYIACQKIKWFCPEYYKIFCPKMPIWKILGGCSPPPPPASYAYVDEARKLWPLWQLRISKFCGWKSVSMCRWCPRGTTAVADPKGRSRRPPKFRSTMFIFFIFQNV